MTSATAQERPGVLHHLLHMIGLGAIADRQEQQRQIWAAVTHQQRNRMNVAALMDEASRAQLDDMEARMRALDAAADNRAGRGSVDEPGPP